MNSRTRTILLLATLAAPARAFATEYNYGSTADLALIPYTSDDQITLAGTTVSASAPALVPASLVRLQGPITFSLANDLALTGALSGSSNSPFTKSGTAALTLSGDSPNYTGAVTLSAGTLRLGSASAIGATSPTHGVGSVNLNPGGTLDLNGFAIPHVLHYNGGALVNDNTLTPVNVPGTGTVAGSYILGGAGDLTFNGQLFSSGPLTKVGPGTLTLTNPNTTGNYSGTINVNGGTLRLATAGAYGNSYGNVFLNPGGIVDLNGISPIRKEYTFNGGTLANNDTASPITLDVNNFYAYGSTTPTASIGFGGAGDLAVNFYLSSYSAPLIKTGAGTLTLVQTAYTQGVQVQGGTLRITSSTTLPQNGSTTAVLPGGSLDLNGLAVPANTYISLVGGALVNNNTTTPVTVFSSPYLSLAGPNLTFGGAGSMTLNVAPSGTQSLTKVGVGTLILNSIGSHTGGTFLLGGATLVANDFPLGAANVPLTITDGTLRNINTFTITRPVTLSGSLGGFDTPSALTITRAVTGTGALNKFGSSNLVLNSTFTVGPVAVQQGALILNGASSSTVVTSLAVSPGASLSMNRPRFFIDAVAGLLPLDSVRSLLLAGRNAGDWLGTGGVTASALSADTSHTRALAYADLALLPTSYRQLAGVDIVDLSSILIRPTFYGDINCDGKLDSDDYTLLDRALAMSPANPHWTDGDFNYDATVDQSDYLLLDTAYLSTHPAAPSPDFFAQRESQFGPAYITALTAVIPEPSLLAPCALALLPLIRRRLAR